MADITLMAKNRTLGVGERLMDSAGKKPRSEIAYEVARRLLYFSGSELEGLSPVQGAKEKLDELVLGREIPESERRRLLSFLLSLEGCDLDRCERTDELIQEVTMSLTGSDEFSDAELGRLHDLLWGRS
jgi:hypothetical protein